MIKILLGKLIDMISGHPTENGLVKEFVDDRLHDPRGHYRLFRVDRVVLVRRGVAQEDPTFLRARGRVTNLTGKTRGEEIRVVKHVVKQI